MRISLLRILLVVLWACGYSITSTFAQTDTSVSLPTNTPIPFTATLGPVSTAAPLPMQPGDLEYSSVEEALADLKAKDDVSIEVLQGWTIVSEADGTTWSFAPRDHQAYPAVAKRVLYRDQDGWHLKMDILCGAETEACNEFVRYFENLNRPIDQLIELQHQPSVDE